MALQITQYLPAKRKQAPSGWISFNAVCCTHRGERRDKRGRGGVLIQPDGSFSAHCFNCGFKAAYHPTESLSHNCRLFLKWLGVDEETINHLNLEALRNRSLVGRVATPKQKFKPKFDIVPLPDGAVKVEPENLEHKRYVDYLLSRGAKLSEESYYVTPQGAARNKNRVIIPFTHENRLVGYTSRFLDNKLPKYLHQIPTGYVFGLDYQERDWEYVLVVEGVFDAIPLRAVAVLHNAVSDHQADLINALNKQVVVVPDRDQAGTKLVERAMELGWGVAFPIWDKDVKDCADAVKRYGKLTTLISIIESIERSRLKIELRSKDMRD